MIRTPHTLSDALRRLCAHDLARPVPDLANALRLTVYRAGRRELGPAGTRSFPTPMDAGLARLRALRVSHAALVRRETFDASLALGPSPLNGIDVSPDALETFAWRNVAWAGDAFDKAPLGDPGDHVSDGAGRVPLDTEDFETRYLRLRLLRALDPDAHAALVRVDAQRFRAASLVADWWAGRLSSALGDAAFPDPSGRVEAFRERLAESVALTGVEEVDMDYDPDAWLGEALDEADIPSTELHRMRKSVAWIHPREGTVLARIGIGGEVETVGTYREAPAAASRPSAAAPTVPGALDVAAFLIGASLPGAILRRIPGALAVAIPSEDPAEPTCLFVTPSGDGLVVVDDGRTLSRLEGDLDGFGDVLLGAGLSAVPDAGEIRLGLSGLDGIGGRLSAMAAAIRTMVRPGNRPL